MFVIFNNLKQEDYFLQARYISTLLETTKIKEPCFCDQTVVFRCAEAQILPRTFFNKTFSVLLGTVSVPLDVFMQNVIRTATACSARELTVEERFVWRGIAHRIKKLYSEFNNRWLRMNSQKIVPPVEIRSLIQGEVISFPLTLMDLPCEIKKQIFSYTVDEKLKMIRMLRPLLFSIEIERAREITKDQECCRELNRYVLLPKKEIQTYSGAKKFLRGVVSFINVAQETVPQFKQNNGPFGVAMDIDKLKFFFRSLYIHQLICCFGDKVPYAHGSALCEVSKKIINWLRGEEAQSLTQLDFSRRGLFCVPTQIKAFKNLSILDLRHNKLRTLPWELLQLKQLHSVDADDNNFCGDAAEYILQKTAQGHSFGDYMAVRQVPFTYPL